MPCFFLFCGIFGVFFGPRQKFFFVANRCPTNHSWEARKNNSKKNLAVWKKVVSLHPLSTENGTLGRVLPESERTLNFWDGEIACVGSPARPDGETRTSQRLKNTSNSYNEEFDPGSGWTLAAGLTHASRGAAGCSNTLPATGARVRNAYATYL